MRGSSVRHAPHQKPRIAPVSPIQEVRVVPIMALWLPILLAAVLVFLVSSILHMVLSYHQSDFAPLPREQEVADALRKFDIPPGDYAMPCSGSPKEMGTPEFLEKMKRGPVFTMTVMPSGPPNMGGSLAQWFLYSLVVGTFAAYLTGRAFGPGTEYLTIFRFTGTIAVAGYALALAQNSIWYKRKWSTTLKSAFDSLLYALVTGGAFGWLWPS
jgi:hypothetical protein